MKTRWLRCAACDRFPVDFVGAFLSSFGRICNLHVQQTRASRTSSCSSSMRKASANRSVSLSPMALTACRFSRRTGASSAGPPDGRKTAVLKSSSPTGTMKRPRASLPKLPSKARPAADPMKHSRPALAFLILLASLALLSAREPASTSLRLRRPTFAARWSFWLQKNWQAA